jgi:hypothetical protein
VGPKGKEVRAKGGMLLFPEIGYPVILKQLDYF